ncbi:MAG TPA: cupin domain-containing protein, partial [Acidimicrobiales bacterium]|nr:cupin domain-containing protein [Acidimicrobiales bacterium]
MEFIRPLDDTKITDIGFPGYRAQFLSYLESALMLASHVEEGGSGPSLHYHHADQFYFLLRGTMTVQLGDDVHKAGPGSLVFIPAGLPHRNWNEGPGTETHFEMIVPTPRPAGARLALQVDSSDDIPEADRTDQPGVVSSVDPDGFGEP